MPSRAREEELFHLYNRLKEEGGHMLVTASSPPQGWNFALPDLRSRLLASPAAALRAPDDGLMEIVLAKMFSDRQIFVPQEVIAFLLPRMERSFSAARVLVDRIDRKALAEKRPVTVPLARDVLQES
jgi:chromosomal replication initiation ATPase DnaA